MTNKILMDFLHSPYYIFSSFEFRISECFSYIQSNPIWKKIYTIEVLSNNKWKRQYENPLPKNNLLDMFSEIKCHFQK